MSKRILATSADRSAFTLKELLTVVAAFAGGTYTMAKLALFPVLLAAACIVAGVYGALHNQISYSVSPEYFFAFKFHQFGIPEHLQNRIGASIVGCTAW